MESLIVSLKEKLSVIMRLSLLVNMFRSVSIEYSRGVLSRGKAFQFHSPTCACIVQHPLLQVVEFFIFVTKVCRGCS